MHKSGPYLHLHKDIERRAHQRKYKNAEHPRHLKRRVPLCIDDMY